MGCAYDDHVVDIQTRALIIRHYLIITNSKILLHVHSGISRILRDYFLWIRPSWGSMRGLERASISILLRIKESIDYVLSGSLPRSSQITFDLVLRKRRRVLVHYSAMSMYVYSMSWYTYNPYYIKKCHDDGQWSPCWSNREGSNVRKRLFNVIKPAHSLSTRTHKLLINGETHYEDLQTYRWPFVCVSFEV